MENEVNDIGEQEMSEETTNTSFAMKVWSALSAIDCSEKIQQKGGFNYLSWSFAWTYLMGVFPESTYMIQSDNVFADNTVEVIVSVTITDGDDSLTRAMRLPVMDHRNAAIQDPDARDLSDARMRCLVKCLALFGLGLYIYSGEDIPRKRVTEDDATDEQFAKIQDYKDAGQIHETTQEWIDKQNPMTEKKAAGLLRRLKEENK